jgi:hypothetical protein
MIQNGKEAGIGVLHAVAKQIEEDEVGRYAVSIVVADEENNTVRMWGVNLDEEDMFALLTESAAIIGRRIVDELENRTLN